MTASNTLAVDIGGTGIKAAVFDANGEAIGESVRVATPYPCPPERLLAELAAIAAALPPAERAGIGFPGLLRRERVVTVNSLSRASIDGPTDDALAAAWRGFALQEAIADRLGMPVIVGNDADVAALACASGVGLECVITLGTGLGFSLVSDGRLLPHMELDSVPFGDGRDFESVLGQRGLDADGLEAWRGHVRVGVGVLRRFVYFDRLCIGGGNARLLADVDLGPDVDLVDNANGLRGGYLLWT